MRQEYRITKRGCNLKTWTHYIFLFIGLLHILQFGIFHWLFFHKCLNLIVLITSVKLKGCRPNTACSLVSFRRCSSFCTGSGPRLYWRLSSTHPQHRCEPDSHCEEPAKWISMLTLVPELKAQQCWRPHILLHKKIKKQQKWWNNESPAERLPGHSLPWSSNVQLQYVCAHDGFRSLLLAD